MGYLTIPLLAPAIETGTKTTFASITGGFVPSLYTATATTNLGVEKKIKLLSGSVSGTNASSNASTYPMALAGAVQGNVELLNAAGTVIATINLPLLSPLIFSGVQSVRVTVRTAGVASGATPAFFVAASAGVIWKIEEA